MSLITIHLLREIPMHNLNRDQNGLPKSQYDGGIQRGRLSSQSIKRPARIAFRSAVQGLDAAPSSLRTMDSNAIKIVVQRAEEIAQKEGKTLDSAALKKRANSVVRSLAKAEKANQQETKTEKEKTDTNDKKDNILLFSEAEFDTLAQALVDADGEDDAPTVDNFIEDFSSPSLDVAAFGRMFAARADKSTQAAVAVSHAVTTHEMSLTIDYFTAVDDFEEDEPATDAGAAHLGLAYYTSGVYYSTFTIDPQQLRRSWSSVTAPTAHEQLVALVRSLITALPTGKLTNTNAHTVPFLVLAEEQKSRVVYGFETPVRRAQDGGYKQPSIKQLADQYELARQFNKDNYIAETMFAPDITDDLHTVERVDEINDLASWVADRVLNNAGEHTS